MTDHLTSRAQRLIEEFEEGESVREGIANVLKHLAGAYEDVIDGEDVFYEGVSTALLVQLAAELTAPSLLTRALAGDKDAARQFLFEAGFIDKHGQLTGPYKPEQLDD
jgi:hypothetical protein